MTLRDQSELARDRATDRRQMFIGVSVIGALFGFGATAQSMLVLDAPPMEMSGAALHPVPEMLFRISLNALIALLLAFLASSLRLQDRSYLAAAPFALLISAFVAAARAVLQMMFGIFPWELGGGAIGGAIVVVPVGFVTVIIGMSIVKLGQRARTADRERLLAAERTSAALDELQQEELRVRREVADTLHGTLQHRFLVLETKLRDAAEQLEGELDAGASSQLAAQLRELSGDVDTMRERELRELSAALYPEGLDRGIVAATRALVAGIPRSIPVEFVCEGVPVPDPLSRTARLLLVRIAEEGISNGLRHGQARSFELRLTADEHRYGIDVRHRGVEPAEDRVLNGLARLRARIADLGGELQLVPEPGGGVLRASIPAPDAD